MHRGARSLLLCWILAAVGACAPTISPFSATAYEQATALKAGALALMTKANEAPVGHMTAIEALQLRMQQAYEYARGRPLNQQSADQWAIIVDPTRNSLGGFLAKWVREGPQDAAFVAEAKGLVSDGLDEVIALESGKRKVQ